MTDDLSLGIPLKRRQALGSEQNKREVAALIASARSSGTDLQAESPQRERRQALGSEQNKREVAALIASANGTKYEGLLADLPGFRVVLSRSCVKQPKVSLVPQSVTLEELKGSFGLGCTVAPELLATMDWRGKHVQKGTPAYTSAKNFISRAHELMKTELSNPQAELWLPGPPGRGFVSPILYVDSSNQFDVFLHADCFSDGKLTF